MEKNMRKCMCVCINTHFIKHTLTSWSSYLRVSTVSHGVCYCPLELRAHVQHALVFFVCLFCFYFFAFVFWACGILKGLPRWFSGKRICPQYRRRGFDPWIGKIPWRREWLPTPVFLPGEFHGQRSLVGYSSWCRKESDKTELLIPSKLVCVSV